MPLSSRSLNSARDTEGPSRDHLDAVAELELYTGCCGVRVGTSPSLGIQGGFWNLASGVRVNQ